MNPMWAALLTSVSVTALAVLPVRGLLVRLGTVDEPNERSSHITPTPRGGGIACAAGVAAGSIVGHLAGLALPAVVLLVCLGVAIIGLVDDHVTLPASPRLAGQVVIGFVIGLALGGLLLGLMAAVVLPIVINSINFMDGVNGITGFTACVWGGAAWCLGSRAGDAELQVIGVLAAGAALGFLPFNAFNARLFLGDVGSYLFGALCGGGIVLGVAHGVSAAPLMAPLSIYFADVFSTLFRRWRASEALMTAHRDHVYQKLVRSGLTHLQVALAAASLAGVITAAWLVLPSAAAVLVTTVVVVLYLILPRLRPSPSGVVSRIRTRTASISGVGE